MEQEQNTKLSVNINKVATIRNARGGNVPNLLQVALDCERFGADGITVHPRPDERHITYNDVRQLKPQLTTEFNIEGNPNQAWMNLVIETVPEQATLVPDKEDAITSNAGYDTINQASILQKIIQQLKEEGIRVSVFIEADYKMAVGAAKIGADRVELYTGPFADAFARGEQELIIANYIETAKAAQEHGLAVNAGHDLELSNLQYFSKNIPELAEVSIGHALISDALYYGLENTISLYKRCLQ